MYSSPSIQPARTCPRLGLQLNTTQKLFRWSEIRQLAVTAEELGFHSLWTEDHLYYHDLQGRVIAPWEAWTTLAALAELTERVKLGTRRTWLPVSRSSDMCNSGHGVTGRIGAAGLICQPSGCSDPAIRAACRVDRRSVKPVSRGNIRLIDPPARSILVKQRFRQDRNGFALRRPSHPCRIT